MARDIKIEVYQDKRERFRARVLAGNGEQIARTTRGYIEKDDLVSDLAEVIAEKHDAEVYKDKIGQYRWRWPGEISILIASESYINKKDCKHASDLILDAEI